MSWRWPWPFSATIVPKAEFDRVVLGTSNWTWFGVLHSTLGEGARLVLTGLALGVVCAIVLSRFVSNLLYGVSAGDPLTYAGVAALLGAVALIAAFLPARRASKVDPMVALRYE